MNLAQNSTGMNQFLGMWLPWIKSPQSPRITTEPRTLDTYKFI